MQRRHIWVAFAVLCFCHPARAQEPFTKYILENEHGKVFIPVYYHYIELLKTQGVAGLKTIATPEFAMKWGKEVRRGAAAFEELKKYVPDPPKNGPQDAFSVTLRRLTIVGDRAIVQTKETSAFHFGDSAADNVWASWIWKQTWRKTSQGWRLALWEQGTEKLPAQAITFTYTISWKPKETNSLPVTPGPSDRKEP